MSAESKSTPTGGKPARMSAGPEQAGHPVVSLPARPEKKIAIIGFTASRDQAPWGQPGWEIWICNNLWKLVPDKWHRLYDLHDLATITSDPEQAAFIAGQKGQTATGDQVELAGRPVVCWEPQQDWRTAVPYPRPEITGLFGNYFTNSISWMIAHAIAENATELHVYGVDMATSGEYGGQRPSCEYFLGLAAGLGIKVYLPPESDLLKVAFMYGAEDDTAMFAKLSSREKELRDRLGVLTQQQQQITVQAAQVQGALEDVTYWRSVWTSPRANRDGSRKEATPVETREKEPA